MSDPAVLCDFCAGFHEFPWPFTTSSRHFLTNPWHFAANMRNLATNPWPSISIVWFCSFVDVTFRHMYFIFRHICVRLCHIFSHIHHMLSHLVMFTVTSRHMSSSSCHKPSHFITSSPQAAVTSCHLSAHAHQSYDQKAYVRNSVWWSSTGDSQHVLCGYLFHLFSGTKISTVSDPRSCRIAVFPDAQRSLLFRKELASLWLGLSDNTHSPWDLIVLGVSKGGGIYVEEKSSNLSPLTKHAQDKRSCIYNRFFWNVVVK